MLTLSCPSCGANLIFRSKSSVFAVCSYCKSTLVRQDMNLSAVGKMSDLQDDMTPLQVGTSGSFGGNKFEIVGRLKVGYDGGFWNEWYVLFGTDKTGWLAEAQGFYGMCFPYNGDHIPPRDAMSPGVKVTVGQSVFEVEDIRSVKCLYSEGELPVNANQGRTSLSVDLSGPNKQMATIEYAEAEVRAFTGKYQDFDQFAFRNLRSIDGW